MPENQEKSRANASLFRAAIRAILEPQKPDRALKNISNKTGSVEKAPDMLQTAKRVVISRNAVCSGANSALTEISKKNESFSSISSPVLASKVSSPNPSNAFPQPSSFSSAQISPAKIPGYLSASSMENSFKYSGGDKTPQTSFAHPDFQNIKYKEPERTSPYADLDFFSSTFKSSTPTCSTQRFNCSSFKNNEISKKNSPALRPFHDLFSFNEGTYFDTHCHLDFLLNKAEFSGSFSDFKLKNQGEFPPSFGGCIAIFCNPYSFKRISLWGKHLKDNVWASFGCHPKNAASYDELIEDELVNALRHPKVCALGEIGLDYSERSMCSESKQKEVFCRQLRIARQRKLPVVIHCRDAHEDCFEILREELPNNYLIHLHCFTDTWRMAEKYLKEFPNLYIGITNLVTFSSAVEVHEVAKKIPLNRLLLETDAPYFVPTALSKKAKFAHPGMAIFVAEKVASLKGVSLQEVVFNTRQNTNWVYGV